MNTALVWKKNFIHRVFVDCDKVGIFAEKKEKRKTSTS